MFRFLTTVFVANSETLRDVRGCEDLDSELLTGTIWMAQWRSPRRRIGGDVVTIGNQLETDIAGALGAGIDAALVAGVSRWSDTHAIEAPRAIAPTYVLADLAIGG